MSKAYRNNNGFTLLEMLVVLVVLSIVAAIAAPSWFNFLEKNRLTTARDEIYLGIRDAQMQAKHRGASWQFSIRQIDDVVEWATHPTSISSDSAVWKKLEPVSIQIDDESTLDQTDLIHYVLFDNDGNVDLRHLGRLTLSSKNYSHLKSCVIVSTVVGAMRKSENQTTPNRSGQVCY